MRYLILICLFIVATSCTRYLPADIRSSEVPFTNTPWQHVKYDSVKRVFLHTAMQLGLSYPDMIIHEYDVNNNRLNAKCKVFDRFILWDYRNGTFLEKVVDSPYVDEFDIYRCDSMNINGRPSYKINKLVASNRDSFSITFKKNGSKFYILYVPFWELGFVYKESYVYEHFQENVEKIRKTNKHPYDWQPSED